MYQQAGMAVVLKNLETVMINKGNLIIEKVENNASLLQWCEIVSDVFGIKVDFDFLKFMHLQEEACFYIAKFEGIVASTLLLYLSSGVAGLHAVSTLPQYRSKGFGLSISSAALKDAHNMGYNIGVLQASSLGENIYRKLGFKKYCDIISYALEI